MYKEILEKIDVAEFLKMNAHLQAKKNKLRTTLYSMGVLGKKGSNNYDHYTYFSEAQYKSLFTELFSGAGLELKFSELSYDTFEGPEKQANGRMPKLEFLLFDIDTGFFERTVITGEGIDKGDKAGYKAYTGALKYYLANTFMVATGDDPEAESPDYRMNKRNRKSDPKPAGQPALATEDKVQYILDNCTHEQVVALLGKYKVDDLRKLTDEQAVGICMKLNRRKTKEMETTSNV